jgi:hypothetical protein
VKVRAELFSQLAANRFKKFLKLMHEDFAGNTLGTAKALELRSSLQTFTGSVGSLDRP